MLMVDRAAFDTFSSSLHISFSLYMKISEMYWDSNLDSFQISNCGNFHTEIFSDPTVGIPQDLCCGKVIRWVGEELDLTKYRHPGCPFFPLDYGGGEKSHLLGLILQTKKAKLT
jgi:hypothetical protein